jgi:DNA adenine methylase
MTKFYTQETKRRAKPFLKWAGGKGQLLKTIDAFLPEGLRRGTLARYVEPFVGGGAVFLHVLQSYEIRECLLADINDELVLTYKTIQRDVESLIEVLAGMEKTFLRCSAPGRKALFYEIRSAYNASRPGISFSRFQSNWVHQAARLIFLNRTCFNGLFRLNAEGAFNVPFGRYRNPVICAEENLRAVASLLQRAEIRCADVNVCAEFVNESSFVYFDPPYRPISKTARFTSYARVEFDDAAQLRLALLFRTLDAKGALLMLSNSDPKNENPSDEFFEQAYKGFRIERVRASRNINSNGQKRGAINELLIMNY